MAKKNPNTTIKNAENRLTGITGTSQITNTKTRMDTPITGMGRSRLVRSSETAPFPRPFTASRKVLMISGRDLTRLMMPPQATAPAPIYLI